MRDRQILRGPRSKEGPGAKTIRIHQNRELLYLTGKLRVALSLAIYDVFWFLWSKKKAYTMSKFAGPFDLNLEDLKTRIPPNTKGAFILITVHEGDPYVRYVGRADSDLISKLEEWIGRYDQYAYITADDDVVAFLHECNAF